jgi:hypothetical protein
MHRVDDAGTTGRTLGEIPMAYSLVMTFPNEEVLSISISDPKYLAYVHDALRAYAEAGHGPYPTAWTTDRRSLSSDEISAMRV